MGFWDNFLEFIGFGGAKRRIDDTPPRNADLEPRHVKPVRRQSSARSAESTEAGSLHTGTVERVVETFAIVRAGSVRAIIFRAEMSDHFVESAHEVVTEGTSVEFMILRPNERRLGEWVGSIAAVAEARTRDALAAIEPGERVKGKVEEIADRGVRLGCDGFTAWVPATELAWAWVGHPAAVVRLGQRVTIEVLRVDLPEGWLTDKRGRRARAIGSLRACLPKPASRDIRMPFSCLPFKVWSVARKPRSCDPVVLHVLEEMVRGCGLDAIGRSTRLPEPALDKILALLEGEQLVRKRRPTSEGRALVEAIARAQDLNANPIRGLFVSTAHPKMQFRRIDEDEGHEYPRAWPRPPSDRRAEDAFNRATDEAIPEMLLSRIVDDDRRASLAQMQSDQRLHVFLRRDGDHPWMAAYVLVPERWVLAGLWSMFDAVGPLPFRPPPFEQGCRVFLMICVRAQVRGPSVVSEQDIYFEPSSATFWIPRDINQIRLRERRGVEFPSLPSLRGVKLPGGGTVKQASATRWCVVEASRGR